MGKTCVRHVGFQYAYEIISVLADAKRLIGRKYDEESVRSDQKHWPFAVSNIISV